jgi:Fe-S-cluster-containing dehydrogenase component
MIRRILTAASARCTGCRICEFVCSLSKTGELNPYRARVRIVPRSELGAFLPVICRHCVKPACFAACPIPGAMVRDLQTGVVRIIEEECIGCRECVAACPFGAIQLNPEGEPLKCDLCGGDPLCVRHCPARPLEDHPAQPSREQSCLQYREFYRVGKQLVRPSERKG